MKFNSLLPLSLFGALALPVLSFAVPAKFAECPHISVKEAPNSSGYFFDEDCTTVYVLPPQIGALRINGYNPTIHSDRICSSINNIEETNQQYHALNLSLARRARRNADKIEEIETMIESHQIPSSMTEDQLYDEIDLRISKNVELAKKIAELDQILAGSLSDYSQREGANARFILENRFDELVETYRDINNELGVAFRRMPLDQSYLAIVNEKVNPDSATMAAVLELIVPQLSRPIRPLRLQSSTQDPAETSSGSIFGDALSGKIRFSAIGTCAMDRSAQKSEAFDIGSMQGHIAANAYYQYQVQVKRRHALTFRMSEFIRVVHEQTKRGGFFSRKTINKLADTRRTSSWIDFHVESEDVRFEYTDEYIQEVKKEFISRALAQIISTQTGTSSAPLALLEPKGKTGSEAISGALAKCPHLYCQLGSSAFKVLGSFFNSKTAVSEMSRQFEGDFSEVVLEKKMVEQVGSLTFE